MIVSKAKYNRDIAAKNVEINDLTFLLARVGKKELGRAKARAEKLLEKVINLDNYELDYEEMPNPLLAEKKPLPSRSEYNERLEEAIRLFRANKNRSEVEKILDVSRKTARKYLQIAIRKRKVKKSDYDTLNQ